MDNSTWTETDSSSANTAKTITHAAETGRQHVVTGYIVWVSGADAGADIDIEIKEGSTVKWKDGIGSGNSRGTRSGAIFNPPLRIATGEAVNLVVSAGGASAVTNLNLIGYTI